MRKGLAAIAPLVIGLMAPGCFEDERVLDEEAFRAHKSAMRVELGEVLDIWEERCEEAQGAVDSVCSSTSISDYDPLECEKLQSAIDATFRGEMELFEIFFDKYHNCRVDWNIERCDAINGRLRFKLTGGVGGRSISSWSLMSPSLTCFREAFME